MPNENPMFHMDQNYDWRWFITDQHGNLVLMSAHSFFNFEDAKRDYELACLLMPQVA
ncbi:hypothetical protein M2337_001631 [Sphingobium sp. B2D3A]|uniref:hypothetical protein n=1 Tax=unclassified Sphingobium TaxID=2611147 RepID=UPI002225B2BE|nr:MULTISPECIES: hypothetical protein [unclassified Sphingobium]MCW2337398.1 hypothetical protein [Sphingobium sp. B2D3A]MCW2383856.1 hypothetical protein [Sphingobium sp. B2D3D]